MAAEKRVSGEKSGIKMEEVMFQPEITRNVQEVKEEEDTQEPEKPSSQLNTPWSDEEIRSFLQEWESLEHMMYPIQKKKNYLLSKSIAQGLKKRGIKKRRRLCLHMLIGVTDLHWAIHEVNKKPRTELLPCPYGEALHRIMDCNWVDSVSSGCPHADMANLPPPEFQLQACTILMPLGEFLWASPYVIYMENPQVARRAPWTPSPPCHLHTHILPFSQKTSHPSNGQPPLSDADPGLYYNLNLDPKSEE